MALGPVRDKTRLQTQAAQTAVQQAVRPQFCELSVRLLLNRLAGKEHNYFDLNSQVGLNMARQLDRFFADLPPHLSQRADQIDRMHPAEVIAAARSKILGFLTDKGKKYNLPPNLNADNPNLIEDFFELKPNGDYDLGQLCSELSGAMSSVNGSGLIYFENVYYVLRAGELLSDPAATLHIVNPITPTDIPQAETISEYTTLNMEIEGRPLMPLFRFAMAKINNWKESLQSIVFKTRFPGEIRDAIRAALTDVQGISEISEADNQFFEEVRADAQNKQENEAKEILQRTLGEVLSMLDPWIKGKEETMPDLEKLTSSLRLALVYYKFIIEPTE